jgi:hypothetical protein
MHDRMAASKHIEPTLTINLALAHSSGNYKVFEFRWQEDGSLQSCDGRQQD